MSSWTSPRTERALTSAEVESGTVASMFAAVAGQAVFAAVAEVADVVDAAAGRDDLHQWAGDAVQRNVTAQGVDFDVAVLHIGESDWAVQGFHVHVTAA